MNWLLWRQHRSQAFVTIAGIGLFAVAVVITGVHMAHIYKSSLAACTSNGTCNLVGNLFSGYGAIIDLVHLSIALPVILGAFVGVTLVAREREHATHVLVWTQTVTRRRWLTLWSCRSRRWRCTSRTAWRSGPSSLGACRE